MSHAPVLDERSPLQLLRDLTSSAARLEQPAPALDTFHLLQQRSSAHQTGIAAIWLGQSEILSELTHIERRCRHTSRSAKPFMPQTPDDLITLHDRSVRRGVRQIVLARRIGDGYRVCSCCSQALSHSVPMRCMLIDDERAIVYSTDRAGELCAVAATDSVVVQNTRRYLSSLSETSLPLSSRSRDSSVALTRRQGRVLSLMADGLTDDKIAHALKVTSRTVRADVSALYLMFDVHSRFELGIAFSHWLAGV